jgi:hypothetical protein
VFALFCLVTVLNVDAVTQVLWEQDTRSLTFCPEDGGQHELQDHSTHQEIKNHLLFKVFWMTQPKKACTPDRPKLKTVRTRKALKKKFSGGISNDGGWLWRSLGMVGKLRVTIF